MDNPGDSLHKKRLIAFCALHADPDQASSAASVLKGVEGVREVLVVDNMTLQVGYLLASICMDDIECLLEGRGFHLDNGLMHKIRRALYRYSEETQRANLNCAKGESNCTQKVFISRYRKRDHGCRDDRPDHWRRYL